MVLPLALAASSPAATPPVPRLSDFPGGRYFVMDCGFSHRNNDDPIAHPGRGGKSHNHTYIGNRNVTASTTASALRGGPTTCTDDRDSSTYWVPTLFDERRNAIPPLAGIVYYVKRTLEPVAVFPEGLKMIAGNPAAKKAQATSSLSWSCGSVAVARKHAVVPPCTDDEALQLHIEFPNCWNGKTTDSPNHKAHTAYSTAGSCPASHPVAVPTLALILIYPPVSTRAFLSSGRFASHADFINGWDQPALEELTEKLN